MPYPRGGPSQGLFEEGRGSRGGSSEDTPAGRALLASGSAVFFQAPSWYGGPVRSERCTPGNAAPTADWLAPRCAPPSLGAPRVVGRTAARPSYANAAPLDGRPHSMGLIVHGTRQTRQPAPFADRGPLPTGGTVAAEPASGDKCCLFERLWWDVHTSTDEAPEGQAFATQSLWTIPPGEGVAPTVNVPSSRSTSRRASSASQARYSLSRRRSSRGVCELCCR